VSRCVFCKQPVGGDRLHNSAGDVAHAACWQGHKADREWRATSRRRDLEASWSSSRTNELTNFPQNWEFARFDNADFTSRVSRLVADGVSKWSGDHSLFVSGPTGVGKTSLVHAWLLRRYEQLQREVESGVARRLRFAFVSGPSISGCRRRSKIGEEARLVELAVDTPLLVLDELGYEPLSEELLFVVDERHKRLAPTVTTTGRTLEDFAMRYGGSVFRKLTEGGTIVEGWK